MAFPCIENPARQLPFFPSRSVFVQSPSFSPPQTLVFWSFIACYSPSGPTELPFPLEIAEFLALILMEDNLKTPSLQSRGQSLFSEYHSPFFFLNDLTPLLFPTLPLFVFWKQTPGSFPTNGSGSPLHLPSIKETLPPLCDLPGGLSSRRPSRLFLFTPGFPRDIASISLLSQVVL